MDNVVCNSNGKIWILWNSDYNCNIIESDEQQITYEIQHVQFCHKFCISFIYTKCRDHFRRPLWDILLHFSNKDVPWCSIGHFNIIITSKKKKGSLMYNMNKSFKFIGVIGACGLSDLGFNGQPFT